LAFGYQCRNIVDAFITALEGLADADQPADLVTRECEEEAVRYPDGTTPSYHDGGSIGQVGQGIIGVGKKLALLQAGSLLRLKEFY
jgi:hypothetical protein